jgi:hypothetical protein
MKWRLGFLATGIVAAAVVVLYAGLLASPEGREHLALVAGQARGHLLLAGAGGSEPSWWHPVADVTLKLFELPLFIAVGGDRLQLFLLYQSQFGDAFPFFNGVALTRHAAVRAVMTSPDQPRGVFLGAQPVPASCLSPDLAIFLSTGPRHTLVREFLVEAVHAFQVSPERPQVVTVDAQESQPRRAVVAALWTRFWQQVRRGVETGRGESTCPGHCG